MAVHKNPSYLSAGKLKPIGVRTTLKSLFPLIHSGLFLSSIIILLMGVLYEGLKWIRVYLNNFKLAKQRQLCPKVALSDVQNDEALLSKSEGGADGGTLRSDEVYRSTVTRENNRIPQWYYFLILILISQFQLCRKIPQSFGRIKSVAILSLPYSSNSSLYCPNHSCLLANADCDDI
jgi:hypothetical protein